MLVALVLFTNGSSYTLNAKFQDAGGLVAGDIVMIGPAQVGTVKSIDITPDGAALIQLGLDSDASPMHQGTLARIYENSLSGIANKYVVLDPGANGAPTIPSGGTIGEDHTYSPVNLDQLFDTLDSPTRQGLRDFIRGQAASIKGRAPQANQTLRYFAPALLSTAQVTHALARDEPAFDSLLVQGAQAMQALASRSSTLTALVADTAAATGAIAGQAQQLQSALTLLPGALTHSTSTFAGLRSELDHLDPLIQQSKPASRRLLPFAIALRQLSEASIPTLADLVALIRNPSGAGDLISLLDETPGLARVALAAFPRLIKEMNDSQAQLDYLREYAPDVVAALTNLGQAGAYYDANGHYTRTQSIFSPFSLDSMNRLQTKPPSDRYKGLQVTVGRCPGSAVQPTPDGSAPWRVPGCNPTAVPPGP